MGLTLGRLDDPVILFRAEEQPAPWLAAGPRMERLLLVGPLSATEGDHNSLFRPDQCRTHLVGIRSFDQSARITGGLDDIEFVEATRQSRPPARRENHVTVSEDSNH